MSLSDQRERCEYSCNSAHVSFTVQDGFKSQSSSNFQSKAQFWHVPLTSHRSAGRSQPGEQARLRARLTNMLQSVVLAMEVRRLFGPLIAEIPDTSQLRNVT